MDIDLELRIPTFVDPQSLAHVGVIAILSEKEFAWAQIVIPDLTSYHSYQDWLDCREGFQIGLAMAGVDVRMVSVALPPFLTWLRLTGTQPCERTLDAFASMLSFLRKAPATGARAMVRRNEFAAHAQAVEAFASHVDFEHWVRHRAKVKKNAGERIEPLPIRVDDFIAWSRCLGETASEAALDAYANLILEFLTQEIEA